VSASRIKTKYYSAMRNNKMMEIFSHIHPSGFIIEKHSKFCKRSSM